MKKIMSALMGLTLLGLFASTYYCSSKSEEIFQAQVQQLNLDYPGLLGVAVLDYRRGLLVSDVQTSLRYKDRDALTLQHQIRHFPWGVRMVTRLAADSPEARELGKQIPLELLQVQSKIDLSGASETNFELPQLTVEGDSGQLQLQGLRVACALDGQLRGGELELQLEGLQVVQPGEADVVLAGVALSSQFSEQSGLPLGNGTLSVEQLSISAEQQSAVVLQQLRYASKMSLEKERLATELELAVGQLELAGESFSDGRLHVTLAGIDAVTVRELQESARVLQQQWLNEQVDPLILQLQLLGLYAQLFKEGLSLAVPQLALHSGDGELQGQGRLALPVTPASGLQTFSAIEGRFQLDIDRSFFATGFRLFDRLQNEGKTALNRAVLTEQAEQLAGGLLQKGLLARRQDGGYRIDFSLAQGQGRLNGQPFAF